MCGCDPNVIRPESLLRPSSLFTKLRWNATYRRGWFFRSVIRRVSSVTFENETETANVYSAAFASARSSSLMAKFTFSFYRQKVNGWRRLHVPLISLLKSEADLLVSFTCNIHERKESVKDFTYLAIEFQAEWMKLRGTMCITIIQQWSTLDSSGTPISDSFTLPTSSRWRPNPSYNQCSARLE